MFYFDSHVCVFYAVHLMFWLPGRQCASLSMVVAMFLCCTRHCFSSSIEPVSWKEEEEEVKRAALVKKKRVLIEQY